MNDPRFPTRAFGIVAFLLVAACTFLALGVIDPPTWQTFCTMLSGLYLTGELGAAYLQRPAAAPVLAEGNASLTNRVADYRADRFPPFNEATQP